MDRPFDPRQLPDAGRTVSHAVELCAALALLETDDTRAWRRCRSAALRYVEAVRTARFGAAVALDLLRRAVATWAPGELTPALRRRLDERVSFWVGTAYGLRWTTAAGAPAQPPDLAPPAPSPGRVAELRAWRDALLAQRAAIRARRLACRAFLVEHHARSDALLASAAACVARSRDVLAESRARHAAVMRAVRAAPWLAAAPGGGARRLTDAEIVAIARRIRRAIRQRPEDVHDDILALRHELSPEDEARVEAALRALADQDP